MNRAPGKFAKPIVVVSKCLVGARCRWDGDRCEEPLLRGLKQCASILPVCPEMEIGLGVPRDRIILAKHRNGIALYQPSTRRQLAQKMNKFARDYMSGLGRVDGFVLKHKSPSCGPRGVKLYSSLNRDADYVRKGTGLFAQEVIAQCGHLAVTDENRLEDADHRESWLTRLFTLAAFRSALEANRPRKLAEFHESHRLLLRTCGKADASRMDRLAEHIVDDRQAGSEYARSLYRLLGKNPRRPNAIEPFTAAMEHYRSHLKASDLERFELQVKSYLDGGLPLAEVRKTVQVWAVRYDKDFVRRDAVYRPYPGSLTDV